MAFAVNIVRIAFNREHLGALRLEVGREFGHFREDDWEFLWVTDFPLVEQDAVRATGEFEGGLPRRGPRPS